MVEMGYLQNKIREQEDKIQKIQEDFKIISIEQKYLNEKYDKAIKIIEKADRIESFKNQILNHVRLDLKETMKNHLNFLNQNNQKWLDEATKQISIASRNIMDKNIGMSYSLTASGLKVLHENKILSSQDIDKISRYADIIDKEGFKNKNFRKIIKEVKTND